MVAAGVFVGAATFISDFPRVALASVLVGGLGKFLATCFAPDEDEKQKEKENEDIL